MGGGGCIVPPRTYFEKVQAVLDKYEILFFADEVITGSGRTGSWLGSETFNIRPDGLSLAKGLASAYQPISAVMINQKLYDAMLAQSRKLGFFAHAFTTTGHPVAVAVALRCQELMEERDVLGNVRRVGALLQERIRGFADHPLVGTTRGVGMMAAVELVADKETRRSFDPSFGVKTYMVDRAREHGLIIRSALSGDSLAFAPPLIMTEAEVEEMMRRFTAAPRRHHPLDRGERLQVQAGGLACSRKDGCTPARTDARSVKIVLRGCNSVFGRETLELILDDSEDAAVLVRKVGQRAEAGHPRRLLVAGAAPACAAPAISLKHRSREPFHRQSDPPDHGALHGGRRP